MVDPTSSDQTLASVIAVAEELGVLKQTVFKVLRRLHITPVKRRDPERRNQMSSFITTSERSRVEAELRTSARSEMESVPAVQQAWDDLGFFYVIQLEPEHDPGRLKLGFTVSVSERLRTHRCSAPYATVVKTWPCRRVWERAAIDCVAVGAEQLHTEVFRYADAGTAVARGDAFFALMPVDVLCADDESDPDEEADAT